MAPVRNARVIFNERPEGMHAALLMVLLITYKTVRISYPRQDHCL